MNQLSTSNEQLRLSMKELKHTTGTGKPYIVPPSYHLGPPGCGCFLEPPDHPSYFVQPIYTRHGTSPPRNQPAYYLGGRGYRSAFEVDAEFVPMPYDNPRVKAWEATLYAYFKNCYTVNGKRVVVTTSEKNLLLDPNTWTRKPQAPENHDAYRNVKRYYPEAEPVESFILNPPRWGDGGPGGWWETENEQPSPQTCKPRNGTHPMNGSWCQWCGWYSKEKASCMTANAGIENSETSRGR